LFNNKDLVVLSMALEQYMTQMAAKEHSQQQNLVYIVKTSAEYTLHTRSYKEISCFVLCIITDCISRQNCT